MAHGLCPVWVGYFLASPIRRLMQNPERVLAPYVAPGMTVLEVGPGMGFFSIPAARLVGPAGRVVCVDVQQGMLDGLKQRAAAAGVAPRIETRLCEAHSLGLDDLDGAVDVVLLFYVVHEVPDPQKLFAEVAATLKPSGAVLFSEPSFHVSRESFDHSLALARRCGLAVAATPRIATRRSAVLKMD